MSSQSAVSAAPTFDRQVRTPRLPLPPAGAEAEPAASARPDPWMQAFYRNHRRAIRGTYTVLLAFLAWELIGRYGLTSKLMFAPFSAVVGELVRLAASGELARHLLASFTAFVIGFGMAAVVGVLMGSAIAMSKAVGEHVDPLINALYATPLIALSPILILSLGIGLASKIAIVFLMTIFPILINTMAGIKSTDDSLIEAARSFAATRTDIFRMVLLPSAVPFIIAGLRLAIGRGLIGVFIGELFGATEGIGYLISISGQSFDVPAMFVGVMILAGAGVVGVAVLEMLERKIAPWRSFDLKA
jgi:ABC-type nitrate/sulfonate/bicarbonate transport system permease component